MRPRCAVCELDAPVMRTATGKPLARQIIRRVEACLIWRDAGGLHLRARCHGSMWERTLPEDTEESRIEELTAFEGEKDHAQRNG